jgi:predicted dinucleotide-binding enzyme
MPPMSQPPREIAILGAGPMGRAVAAAASRAGQRVFFGSSRLGLAPVDVGPLSSARLLEPLAQLAVELVERQGRPAADTAFALARR